MNEHRPPRGAGPYRGPPSQPRDKRERERREKLEAEKKERLEQERKERLQ